MRKYLTIMLLTFSLALSQVAFANSTSDDLLRFHLDVDLKVKLLSTMIQVDRQLTQAHDQLSSQNLSPQEFDRRFADQFKIITESYVQTQVSHGAVTVEQKNIIQRILSQLNWAQLSKVFLSTYRSMRVFTRTHGIGLMAALILTNVVQYSIGYLLVLAGQPVIALTLTQIPTTPPTIFAHHVISNAMMKKKMTSILGGEQAYKDYKKMKKDVLKHLHLHHAQDVFVPVVHSSGSSAITLNQSSTFTKIAQQFNLARDKLTVTSLRGFLQKNQIDDAILFTLLRDSTISEYARLTMALTHMSEHLSVEHFSAFKHQFSKNFTTIPNVDGEFDKLHEWIKRAVVSRSKNDLEAAIRQPPTGVHPQHIFESWEKIILPELARGDQLSYQDIRQLATRFHSIKVENEMRSQPLDYSSVRQNLNDYFKQALNARSRQCFRSQQEIIVQLLKDL